MILYMILDALSISLLKRYIQHMLSFIYFLKSIFLYSIKSRWLFLLLFFGALLILVFDLVGHTGIQNKRDTLWTPILEHYVAFGTFIVAFAAWFSNVKRDWKEKLPKRLSVKFIYNNKTVMQCDYAYLSGESDIRQMGQQMGAQIAADRQLNFNIANIVWKEKEIIYCMDGLHTKDNNFFEGKLPFRHYMVKYQLSCLPENIKEGYKYIWKPPFDLQQDKQDKEINLQYNEKQPIDSIVKET